MKKLLIIISWLTFASCSQKAYMFTSFHEPADQGLRLLYSYDGYKWTDLDTTFLKPMVGMQKVMRDPSVTKGPDGTYHLVWTSSWKTDKGFGYASTKDFIHWSEERFIPVMEHEPATVNVWAPELFYDKATARFVIVWASTIPYRFPKGQEPEDNNHRLYYTTTQDFKTFDSTRLFLDPGFSAIDAEIIRRKKDDYVLVVKDNTRPMRNIKVGFASNATGPYTNISAPFTENFTEGPSVAKVKDGWLIYYDSYRRKIYGAAFTRDFKTFTDASAQVQVPEGHKHGTVFMISRKELNRLMNELKMKNVK
jgi:hypothetical protein